MPLNPRSWSFRTHFLAGAVACFGLIGYALYVQFGMLLMPCPLCILQRIAFATMAVFFLIAAIHAPRAAWLRRSYALLVSLAAFAGAGVAGRHVWLQSLPADKVPLCNSIGLEYLLETSGPLGALRTVLQGSGECAKVDWTLLGLSMPVWTFACFIALALWALWAGFKSR